MIFLLAISSAAFGQGSQLSQLDGEWYSNQWRYGYKLTSGIGVATSTNSPNFKVGDRIIFLQQSSDKAFEGTQVYTDGKFYKITVQQQSNDTLLFKGEKNVSWIMTRKTQTTAPQQATTQQQETSTKGAPWYGVSGVGGVVLGGCTSVMSASEVVNLAQMGMARIDSEKTDGGKVVVMTFSFQGQQATIYRDKATCEAVATTRHKQQNTTPDRYK